MRIRPRPKLDGQIFLNQCFLVAVVSLLVLGSATAQTPENDWEILAAEFRELYRTAKYDRAAVVANKALEVAEKAFGPDDPLVATSLNNLALLYKTQGQNAEAERSYEIVRTKTFEMRPMSVDEAVLQMEMLGHDFFFFLDADNGKHSVLYHRKDGALGLIEPS